MRDRLTSFYFHFDCVRFRSERKTASRSWLRGSCRQLHVELLAQCGQMRVVAIRAEERCDGQLRETGVVRGKGGLEPLKHLVGLLANRVEYSDLKCAAVRILGDKILEPGV